MGPDANIQPVLLGDQTMKIIEQLMNAIGEFADTVKGTKTTAWGIPLPLDFLMPGCEALSQHCKSAIKGLDDAKSEKIHVSKI